MLMKLLVPRRIFYLDVGKIIDPDLTLMRRRSGRLSMRLSGLQPARELHVRQRRCFDAMDTIRLGRCRRADPKISAEPSAKARGFT